MDKLRSLPDNRLMELTYYSLETLEFGKALEIFERHLRTPLSPRLLRASRPTTKLPWLRSRFEEIREALALLDSGKQIPFEGFSDVGPILVQAAMPGACCEGPELVRVQRTLQGVDLLSRHLRNPERPLVALDPYRHRLLPFPDLEKRLRESLEEDGSLKDGASPALRRLRERIRKQRSHIQRRLEEMCRNPDIRQHLQDEYFTERGGRYVLPVQSNYKRRLPGIQHGKSVTGTTAYIEPFELVESGNLLVEALEEESEEILRILKELTNLLREQLPALTATLEAVAEFDLVISLAECALEMRSDLPEMVESGALVLRDMRHPLLLAQLPREVVVSNDLILETDCAGLVITGPNTGGKTVVMKTAGLLCLLALAGLPIPCGQGTTIPLLGGVLADIGDDQSIEASLSTFSSHVSRMKSFHDIACEIQDRAGCRPLVILDELGAGTDPAEGASIGRALVEDLIEHGAWILVATHLGDLKLFGYSNPRLKTGAMRFDGENLSPTYQLLMDSVGESHGLQIAERLGLSKTVIARAQELMDANPNQAAALLHRLTEEERRARELRGEVEETKREIEEKKETLLRRIEQAAKDEQRILDVARREAERKIESAKRRMAGIEDHIRKVEHDIRKGHAGKEEDLERREKEIAWMERELVRRLQVVTDLARKYPNFTPDLLKPIDAEYITRIAEPDWKRLLRQINSEEKTLESDFPKALREADLETEFRPGWEDVSPGDQVKVEGIERPVLVAQKDERRKRLSILIGDLQSEIPFERVLQRIQTSSSQQHSETASVRISGLHKSDIPGEINLIGMTVEEMEPVLQKYLDDAALSGWDGVRIIHGHGAGILRNAVRRLIKGHPQVARFQEAESFEGGAGATVAVMRK